MNPVIQLKKATALLYSPILGFHPSLCCGAGNEAAG
jgi:hypothetical protein